MAAYRVLLVDDDADIREVLSGALRDEGYEVCCLANGAEALALLRSATVPDVIVMDLMMPEMDGWAFREELQGHPDLQSIPVIYMSAAAGVEEEIRTEYNAAFIPKPLDLHQLLSALRASVLPTADP